MDELKIFALKVSDLIYRKEKETNISINWELTLESYGFIEIFNKYSEINRHQSFDNSEYVSCINNILIETIKKDRNNSQAMLNYFLNKFNVSKSQFNNLFPDNFRFIEENNDELNKTVFISHASKDNVNFDNIKKSLDNIGFDYFIAEEDIELSEEWEIEILNQLNESNIIIPILSKNFKESNYCDLELGIALQKNSLVIPLTVDTTHSYGFVKNESKDINDSINVRIPKAILKKHTSQMISHLISRLNDLNIPWDYDLCNLYLKIMESYFDKFDDTQVFQFVNAVISNNQLHGDLGKSYLKKFYEINSEIIPKNLIKDFKRVLFD